MCPLRRIIEKDIIMTEINKISDSHQKIREESLFTREKEIESASLDLSGAWSMWRNIMNKEYNLNPKDEILRDGTIKRAEKKESEAKQDEMSLVPDPVALNINTGIE